MKIGETDNSNGFRLGFYLIALLFSLIPLSCNNDNKISEIEETFRNPPEISSSNGVLDTTPEGRVFGGNDWR